MHVITNSSSEVFVVRKEDYPLGFIDKIQEFHKDHELSIKIYEDKYQSIKDPMERHNLVWKDGLDYFCSGDGGEIFEEIDGNEVWIYVDISFEATHDFIRNNLPVTQEFLV